MLWRPPSRAPPRRARGAKTESTSVRLLGTRPSTVMFDEANDRVQTVKGSANRRGSAGKILTYKVSGLRVVAGA
jgi:hypothetical protein